MWPGRAGTRPGGPRASSRRMVTASWIAASASSRRPGPPAGRQVAQRARQVGGEHVRASRRQPPVDVGGLLDGGQRLLAPAQVRQVGRQVVQRHGQVGAERVRAGRRQPPADGDGLLDRGQRLLPPAQIRPAGTTGCSATPARPGQKRVRAGRGQLPADGDGLLDRGQRLLPPPQLAQPEPSSSPATWPGRAGTRPGGPRPAPGRASAPSWIAASASSRRPRPPSRTDRLFSDMARRLPASGSPPRASARYRVTC